MAARSVDSRGQNWAAMTVDALVAQRAARSVAHSVAKLVCEWAACSVVQTGDGSVANSAD